MLEHIDDVDWRSLEHAYGEAGDVPDIIRDLLDDENRDRAMHALFGNIFHQGTRYPATPHAIPFLVEILAGHPPARADVLHLVWSCCAGWLSLAAGPYNADGAFDITTPDDDESRSDTSREIRAAIDAAAAKAIPLVRGFLDDDNVRVRREAAAFLACFRTRASAAEIVPALERRFAVEKDAGARAMLVFALAHTLPTAFARVGQPSSGHMLARIHDDAAEDRGVRLMAAIMLARRMKAEAPANVAPTIAAALSEESAAVDAVWDALPIHTDGARGDAASALGMLGEAAQQAALPSIVKALRTVSDFEAVPLLEAAMAAAFGPSGKAPKDASALSPEQRELLDALVQNDEGFWMVGNAFSVMHVRDVPSMREELAQYLGVTFTHDEASERVRSGEMFLTSFHDPQRALDDLDKAIEQKPEHPRAHLLRGFALLGVDEVESAAEAFAVAADLCEGEDKLLARKNAGVLLGRIGRREEALRHSERNTRDFPDSSATWYDHGLSLVKMHEYAKCVDAIKKCLALEPEHGKAHYTIACAYALMGGHPEDALHHIERAARADATIIASMRDDSDFDSLRDDPRFDAALAHHSAR